MSPRRSPDQPWWVDREPLRPGVGPVRAQGRKPFGARWWGAAWIEALEHRASLDPSRLPRGRTYARTGQVGALEIRSGEVVAQVQGTRAQPYDVRVGVDTLPPEAWDKVLDALAAEARHAAALLDGELLPEVAGDVRAVGSDLLPGPGDLQPRCSCPDYADPCKHAAAVCYLVADELDRDPFLLLTLRGRDRQEVLAGLRRRRAASADPARRSPAGFDPSTEWGEDEGVPARQAWARSPGPRPSIPPPSRAPGRPTVLVDDPPAGSGIRAESLPMLAADAAARAWAVASGDTQTGLDLSVDEDLARWAEVLLLDTPGGQGPSGVVAADLARRTGLSPRELGRRALAWRDGGVGGVAALVESWDPAPAELAPGRSRLGPGTVARRNRLTRGEEQLRLGRDRRWYPFRKTRHGWDPNGPPFEESELV